MCEKRLTFLYTNPCDSQVVNMSNITFGVPRLGRPTFVFKKCSDKIYVHD